MALRLACLLLLLAIAPARAQVTLKVSDYFPPSHFVVTQGLRVFMDKATALSGGRLKFQYYPAQQLGKAEDLLSLTQAGVTDIAFVAPSFTPDKLPLSVVDELPGMYATSCEGTQAFQSLTLPGGLLDAKEFKPNGVRVLLSVALSPYTVQTATRPVASLDDLAGLKIYTAGGAKETTIRALGAVPVRMAVPEAYQAVQRGTVDGTLLSFLSLRPYDLDSVLHHTVVGVDLGSSGPVYAIGERAWARLPAELQAALTEAGRAAAANLCAYTDANEAAELDRLQKAGMTVARLSDTGKTQFQARLETVQTAWAKGLDDRGRGGSAVLAAFKAALPASPAQVAAAPHGTP